MGCSLLISYLAVENLNFPTVTMSAPSDQAAEIMKKLSVEETRLLLRYQSAEQNRRYTYIWEEIEIGLAVVLAGCLFLGTQKRLFPMILCGIMLMLVLFEHFAITPELNYRGREADFPPGSASFGTQKRVYALDQVYIVSDGAKLVLGAILASYLFVFRTKRRARKSSEIAGLPDPSHADR
jgi:hypothetical protein